MNLLEQIYRERREALEIEKRRTPLTDQKSRAMDAPPVRPFETAIRPADHLNIVAEIKFRSPSAGVLNSTLSTEQIAGEYAANGADAISVLTEPNHFGGDLSFIAAAKRVSSVPVLRKDFLFDSYQIYESRAAGADAILLIAAMLQPEAITDLSGLARELGLAVLLELHDEDDLARARGIEHVIWGVNHRNLRSLRIDLAVSERLFPLLPTGATRIAESGIETPEHAKLMHTRGADAILVGTSLMRHASPGHALSALLAP